MLLPDRKNGPAAADALRFAPMCGILWKKGRKRKGLLPVISTKGRYALQAMLDLAAHEEDGFISLKSIAERQNISLKYLESIAAMLTRGGLLISQRGKDGGYRLSRSADEINAFEVIHLTEGSIAPVACLADEMHCTLASACLTLPMWKHMDDMIEEYLSGITLGALLRREV